MIAKKADKARTKRVGRTEQAVQQSPQHAAAHITDTQVTGR